MKKIFLLLVILVIISGCASAKKMNRLSIGMTKQDVIKTIGTPSTISASGKDIEVLFYKLYEEDDLVSNTYYVILESDKVIQFSRAEDSGTPISATSAYLKLFVNSAQGFSEGALQGFKDANNRELERTRQKEEDEYKEQMLEYERRQAEALEKQNKNHYSGYGY